MSDQTTPDDWDDAGGPSSAVPDRTDDVPVVDDAEPDDAGDPDLTAGDLERAADRKDR